MSPSTALSTATDVETTTSLPLDGMAAFCANYGQASDSMLRWILNHDAKELETSAHEYHAAPYAPTAISAEYANVLNGIDRVVDEVRAHGGGYNAASDALESDSSHRPDDVGSAVDDYFNDHCGPDGPLEEEPLACDRRPEATALWGEMAGSVEWPCVLSAPTLASTGDPFVYVDSTDDFVVLAVPRGLIAEPNDHVDQHGTLIKVTYPERGNIVDVVLSAKDGWRLECNVEQADREEPGNTCSAHSVWYGNYDVTG